MAFNDQMTDVTRRAKARCIRALIRLEDPVTTVEQAAKKHRVSRATAYNIVKALEEWELTASPEQEAMEILIQTRQTSYDPDMWLLVSGRMLMGYIQGHDGIGPELFGGAQHPEDVISVDPLCE